MRNLLTTTVNLGVKHMKYRTLIVDDEYPARRELRYILDEIPEIEVVGEAANAKEAQELVKALDYSVIFVDIQMPEMTGLELGAIIKEMDNPPALVFVTAFENYAVQAFDVDAVDYVLKPFSDQRVQQAVEKIKKYFSSDKKEKNAKNKKAGSNQETIERKIQRIPVEKQGKTLLVSEKDIVYAYTDSEYVCIKTESSNLVTRFTLKDLENRLCDHKFFRTHRCFLVNLDYVREIIPFFNGTYNLRVNDNENSEVPVSRTQAKKLKKILGL